MYVFTDIRQYNDIMKSITLAEIHGAHTKIIRSVDIVSARPDIRRANPFLSFEVSLKRLVDYDTGADEYHVTTRRRDKVDDVRSIVVTDSMDKAYEWFDKAITDFYAEWDYSETKGEWHAVQRACP